MLPFNLLIARSRAGKIRPVYVPVDHAHAALASDLVEGFQKHLGRRKGELLDALEEYEGLGYDYRLIRGLSTLLERRCIFEAESQIDPREARRRVFAEANRHALVATEEVKKAVLSKAASILSISPQQLEASLWSDMDEELVLKDFIPIAAEDLLRQYNMSLTQTLLFKATMMEFEAGGNYKQIFRRIKYLGLIYTVQKEDDVFKVMVDGPMALFKLTDRYGTSLAKLLPTIVEAGEWRLKASIVGGERHSPRILQLELDGRDVGDSIRSPSADEETRSVFDSSVEERFARSFEAAGTGWRLRREPEPFLVGRHVMIPDFGFEKEGMKAYLEVVGFWTEDYLAKKVQKLKEVHASNMVVAVDRALGCSRFKGLTMEVIFYERDVPVKPVIDYLRAIEEQNVAKQVESLASARLRLEGDVVSLEELADKFQTSNESVRRWLQSAPVKGYRLIGDLLVSENKLDDIDRRVSELGEAKLLRVTELIQAMGIGTPHQVLGALGYTVKWDGLDQEKATISKKKT
jgi:predicted nuclease of restriction endonuclease-like RecB superfamily